MFGFIFGALVGGAAAWWWRRDIQTYVERTLPDVREKTADRLTALEQRAEEALGKAREKIDRMRPSGSQQSRDTTSSRTPSNYTQGTGV